MKAMQANGGKRNGNAWCERHINDDEMQTEDEAKGDMAGYYC